MEKLEILHGLQQTIKELKEKRGTLSTELETVRRALTADHFLSAELCNTMKYHLERILELENTCEQTYETLEKEHLPQTYAAIEQLFEKKELVYQEQEYYGTAIDFFLSLESEDFETQELLELHQAVLRDVDRKNPLSEEDKTMLEEYVQFVAAYRETDGVKLIEYSQKLAKTFENQLISSAVFKQGLHPKLDQKPSVEQEVHIEGSPEKKPSQLEELTETKYEDVLEPVEQVELNHEESFETENQNLDATFETEASYLEESFETEEADFAGSIDGQDTDAVVEEPEDTELSNVFGQKTATSPAGSTIEMKAAALTDQKQKKKFMLVPCRALRANAPLNIKEFKRDLSGPSVEIRKLILNKAYQYGGITIGILENLTAAPQEKLSKECEELYNRGYLYRYELKERGVFYGLTERGGQAFSIENTAIFLDVKVQPKKSFAMLTEEAEARATYLLLQTIERLQKKIEISRLSSLSHTMRNSFFLEIEQRGRDEKVLYTGWAAKEGETIESYAMELRTVLEKEHCQGVVVVDEDCEQAGELKAQLEQAVEAVFLQESQEGDAPIEVPEIKRVTGPEKEKKHLRSALVQEAANRTLKMFSGTAADKKEPETFPISKQKLEEAGVQEMSQEDMDALLADTNPETV
ncbi:MAG: hypothetical protein ACI4HI_01225 [Lachnospiraceae bacterium]